MSRWWGRHDPEPNPLAVGTFCDACDTRLNTGDNTNPDRLARECPVCGKQVGT